jgi:hypothetical protein
LIERQIHMPEFISTYLDLAGPAVLAGLAIGSLSYLLFGGRDMRTMIMAAGTGVVAGVVSAILQAALGVTGGGYMPTVAAVAAGATAGFVMRPRGG